MISIYGINNGPTSEWMQKMSHNDFHHLLDSVNALLLEQMRQLRDELDSKLAASATVGQLDLTPEELAEQELQRRLVAAGLLSEIKLPPRFMPPREPFTPVPIKGEPLSETIIRERR
jgi:hypothetical protein